MKLKKVLALVLSAALVVSAFAGCGGNSSKTSTESTTASESSAESTESTASGDSTPAASGDATAIFTPKTVDAAKTISLNAGMEPTGLNTLTSTYSIEFALFMHMYENLVTLDDDDNTAPGAAESWDYDEDTLTYTFHLRKDGVWTNGDPVTAKDFEFAWSQALNPDVASDYAYFLYFIKNAEKYFNGEVTWDEVGVKVVDDYTLEVTLEQPTPYALFLFSFGTLAPINQRFYEAVGADLYSTEAQYFCTNGPFALTEWSHNDKKKKNNARTRKGKKRSIGRSSPMPTQLSPPSSQATLIWSVSAPANSSSRLQQQVLRFSLIRMVPHSTFTSTTMTSISPM